MARRCSHAMGNSVQHSELNNHIVFKAHEDSTISKAISSALWPRYWFGGRLILRRYGYGADLEATDLLIRDNANELHGNLGPSI